MIIFFSFIGKIFSAEISNRLFVILGSTIGFYTMFYFTKKIIKNNFPAFLAGLFFGFNPWVISRILAGHMGLLIAYGLIPIFLVFLFDALGVFDEFNVTKKFREKIKPIVLSSIILTTISSAVMFDGLILTMLITFVMVIPWLAHIILSDKIIQKKKIILESTVTLTIIIVITILLSAYWIIPIGIYTLTSYVTTTSQAILPWLHSRAVIENVLTLKAYWWTEFSETLYSTNSVTLNRIYLLFSWIPFLALLNIFPNIKKSKNQLITISLFTVFLIGIILSMGTNLLGTNYQIFTLFGIFRDPEKFSALIALPYAFFIALFANKTINYLINKKLSFIKKPIWIKSIKITQKTIISLIVIFFFTSSFLIITWPSLTGNFRDNYDSLEMPEAYPIVNSWLKEQEDDFRVLWLPSDDYLQFDWSKERGMGEPMRYISRKPTVQTVDPSRDITPWTSLSIMQINHLLVQNETLSIGKILGPMNVKYIIFRDDVVSPSFPNMLSSLMMQTDLTLKFTKEPLYVFENNNYLPIIRSVSNSIIVADATKGLLKLSYLTEDFSDISYNYLEYLGVFNENIERRLEESNAIFYSLHNQPDLLLATIPQKYRYDTYPYANSFSETNYFEWVQTIFEKETRGSLYYGAGTGSTYSGTAQLNIPIEIDNNEEYEIWIRLFGGLELYEISINNVILKPITTTTHSGFNWIKYSTINLEKNKYTLTIKAKQESYLHIIDEIIIAPTKDIQQKNNELQNILSQKSFFVFIEAEELQQYDETHEMNSTLFSQKRGILLNGSADTTGNEKLIIPKTDQYIIAIRGGSTFSGSTSQIKFISNTNTISTPIWVNYSLNWYYSTPITLEKDQYNIKINGTKTGIDALLIFKASDKTFWNPITQQNIQYSINTPADIQIKTNQETPQTIVYSFSYDQYWKSSVNNNPETPYICDAFSICTTITQSNQPAKIKLNYDLQTSSYTGTTITLLTIITLTIVYIWRYIPKTTKKQLNNFLDSQQQIRNLRKKIR